MNPCPAHMGSWRHRSSGLRRPSRSLGLFSPGWPARRTRPNGPIKMVALGDSLTAGFQLTGRAAFPAQLERALKAKGLAVEIANAGVGGRHRSGGLARLDWSVPTGTDAVILELGANDMLRGIDPKITRAALERNRPPPEGAQYRGAAVRHAGCAEFRAGLCARVRCDLSGACDRATFWCSTRSSSMALRVIASSIRRRPASDRRGVARIVTGILPKAEELFARVRAKRASDVRLFGGAP